MNYNYTNLSAFFIYGGGTAELWETSFNEHYYPYLPDCYANITLNLELPDSIFPLCSYPLKHTGSGKYGCRINGMLQQSLSLALLQKDAYILTTAGEPYNMDIYQIAGMQCSKGATTSCSNLPVQAYHISAKYMAMNIYARKGHNTISRFRVS